MSKRVKFVARCCMCNNQHHSHVSVPDGWAFKYGEIDGPDSDFFCPDHAAIEPFTDDQCPGCVGGWGDCGLWTAFSYSDRRTIEPKHLQEIRRGRCPFRVNGTIGVSAKGIEDINLSERASTESGDALASAIEEYCRRYPKRSTP